MKPPTVNLASAISVRLAREADAPQYRDLRLEALRDHPETFSSDYAANLARPMTFWTDRLRTSGMEGALTLFFALHEDHLIGMCGITPGDSPKTRHTADVVSVYVRPEWRGRGIADSLLATCLDWARDHGIRIVKLGVGADNVAAICCYARNGFRAYGLEPDALVCDGVSHDELLMTRALEPR